MTAKEVAALLKGYDLGAYKMGNDTGLVSNMYTPTTALTVTNGSALATGVTTATAIADITADGKVVEIYATDAKMINEIVELNYSTVEVEKITVDKKTGYATYVFSDSATVYDTDPDKGVDVVFAAEVAVDDIVTVYDGVSKRFVYPTTKIAGALTTFDQDGVYTIGGDTYTASAAYTGDQLGVAKEANYYLDQYGYIVKTTAISASSSNYAYVLDVLYKWNDAFGGGAPAVQVKVLLADGTVGVYDAKVKKESGVYKFADYNNNQWGSALTDDNGAVAIAALKSNVFTYTVSDKTIAFKSITALNTGSVDGTYVAQLDPSVNGTIATAYVAKNDTEYPVATISDPVMNSKTTYIFWDSEDEKVSVVVGNTNLGDNKFYYNVDVDAVVSADEGDWTVKYVFVIDGNSLEADKVDAYGYIKGSAYTTSKNDKDEPVYTYTMTLTDGTTLKLTSDSNSYSNGLYDYNSDNTVGDLLAGGRVVSGHAKVSGSVIKMLGGSVNYNWTEDTKVVYLSDTYSTVDDAAVFMYTNKLSDGGKNILAIFVVDENML